jgi:aminomethyltransferase
MTEAETLKRTVLHDAHVALGARMVPFAGYGMPVQYQEGVLAEHRWTREHAGLFDVSHMGPAFLTLNRRSGDGQADHAEVAAIVETLVCGDIRGLKPGQLRYTLLLNEDGGMLDDLIVGRPFAPELQGTLYIVVNAGTKDADYQLIGKAAGYRGTIERLDDNALLALQGPEAAEVLETIIPGVRDLSFMTFRRFDLDGEQFLVSRSGYTGEDGFEILVPQPMARDFWDRLLRDERVRPIGLGARDSLRLEAGLPLYGHDADDTVSPIEAGLNFAVSKRRREARDFPGADRVAAELAGSLKRVRVGLKVQGAPAREGAEIADEQGQVIGRVTSGGPSPTLGGAVAMGFVPPASCATGTRLQVIVRGRAQPAEVVPTPFVPHRYFRKAAG